MLNIFYTRQFKKDLKKQEKSGKDIGKIKNVMLKLINREKLGKEYRDHKLLGNFKDRRECHITPDWLLIYKLTEDKIIFERTGSHSELFI